MNDLRMAAALHESAMASGDLSLMTTAIATWRQVLDSAPSHPYRAEMLSSLNQLLRRRFEWSGESADLTDLDEAIRVGREAVQVAPNKSQNLGGHLSDLGVALRMRFEQTAAPTDIEEAIAFSRTATEVSAGDEDHAGYLSNLSLALWTQFERYGQLADIDEAITTGREAVQADHPLRAMFLSNLSNALQIRFESTGSRTDLDEAITHGRETLRATSADDPDRAGYLSNLGAALRVRFELTRSEIELDEAVTVSLKAVQVAKAADPDRAGFLSNAGLALRARFELAGVSTDLDEAIRLGRVAVNTTTADHPDHAMYQSNLGALLQLRSTSSGGRLVDLDEAITAARAAVQTAGVDHPDHARYWSNLGAVLLARSRHTTAQPVLDQAVHAYTQSAQVESAPPSVRARAAGLAASLVAPTDTTTAADLFELAVRLLPETVPRRLGRGDQQHTLGPFAGLASDAAALALQTDETNSEGDTAATRALQLLELGRGILLSQALDTRSDLTILETQRGAEGAALAARFRELRDQLDRAGDTTALVDNAGLTAKSGVRGREDRHNLAARFEATVNDIRSLDGFKTFLQPPDSEQLMRQATEGAVVVVNVSQYRSDAILLRPDRITSVPLPGLEKDALTGMIDSFHQALRAAHHDDLRLGEQNESQKALSAVLEWLWDTVAEPILNALGHQHPPVAGARWPRVWWAPGGLLGLLPLHAAGYHREPAGPDGGRRTVMDRVISSYTPTVRALGFARERTPPSSSAERALIVAMPTTPGLDPLHNALREARMVSERFIEPTVLIEDPASGTQLPTQETVLHHMQVSDTVHFACHGTSDAVDPSRSRLFLHDHDSAPLTVKSLAPVRLNQARLAYLSACRTMLSPSADLIDEAIHLTAAFQLAGYPQVVGTLWEIADHIAVRVARTFYDHYLCTGSTSIETRDAAQALHRAVRAVRDNMPCTPFLWAAYVHAGA